MGLLPCFLDHWPPSRILSKVWQCSGQTSEQNRISNEESRCNCPTMGVHGYTGTGKNCYLNEAEGAWWSSIGKTGETSRCGTADNAKASAKPLTDILWYTWLLVPLGQNHGTYHGLTPYPGCKWKWTLNFFWRRLGQPFFCPLMLVQCCTGNRFHLSKVEKKILMLVGDLSC